MKEIITARNVLLKTHYGRFNSLVKDGPEWLRLAESGSVWDSIYNVRNKELWIAAQRKIEERVTQIRRSAGQSPPRWYEEISLEHWATSYKVLQQRSCCVLLEKLHDREQLSFVSDRKKNQGRYTKGDVK